MAEGSGLKEAHYDALVIGCGMSGLGAGIRLAMSGRRVLLVERHNAPGGLNSFYFLGGRKMDVGLHALTNYLPPGHKGALTKICRQLRIDREAFDLCPQKGSRIAFPGVDLRFGNGLGLLESEVARVFPAEIDRFRELVRRVDEHEALDTSRASGLTARSVLSGLLREPLLAEMLLCPILYYGSAREDDVDFDQFCILFRALFMEGFARPFEGVRVILRVLLERYREAGGERRMKCGVRRLHLEGGRVKGVELDDGTLVTADHILSSAGADETLALLEPSPPKAPAADFRRLSYCETLSFLDREPASLGWEDTIVFFNDSPRFIYRQPGELVDLRSGVICLPNNYEYGGRRLPEGLLRVTGLASHALWTSLEESAYRAAKERGYEAMTRSALRFLAPLPEAQFRRCTVFHDMFTPRTVERFTGHIGGAVYGSPHKLRDGRSPVENLYICGTDQGFLGIVGALLSGISMANAHVIGKGAGGR